MFHSDLILWDYKILASVSSNNLDVCNLVDISFLLGQ